MSMMPTSSWNCLPGPRDRDGLPDSIRFWKRKIEQIDPDLTFKVGLIYGPSGCGKSSLVKAGLLPRLASTSFRSTSRRPRRRRKPGCSRACARSVPTCPRGLGLVDSLASLRQGSRPASEQKVLLVLDQFEQWLHAKRGEENTELVAALRHCDGEHVQAVVMVRDDFWLAATRFMRDLEIRLLEGREHRARRSLRSSPCQEGADGFRAGLRGLPENVGDLSSDQEAFLDQSIAGLAQDGKIISVRLALFAEMVKGKPWTPATLEEVGGTEGVGSDVPRRDFSSPRRPLPSIASTRKPPRRC